MRVGRQVLPAFAITLLVAAAPATVSGQAGGTSGSNQSFDMVSLLVSRDPVFMVDTLKEGMQEKVKDRWAELVMEDSEAATARNQADLYPNPSLQAYVNRLGQSLIPREASENVLVSFKIIEDPLPYADALATGTVYLSSGLVSLLDNESQLAFLLMHEAGHVVLSHHLHQIVEEEKAEKRAKKIKLIGAAAGLVAGGLLGGKQDALVGAGVGFLGSDVGLSLVSSFRNHRFVREIQLESDQFATEILLQHGFDAREAPVLMAKIGEIVRRSSAVVDLAFGNSKDLPQRSSRMTELLVGSYRPVVDRILEGEGFRMSSPRYSQLMSELKRDNGLLALERDLFAIARTNLEEAAAVRTDDPLTMYGLGMLYRAVGRTPQDVSRAAGYFKSAMEFDEVRHQFPEVHLQYAVELLSREDPRLYPEIQKALRTYVVLYQRKRGGGLPREMRYVYDYLELSGDPAWIAYGVSNVSSEVPYQLTGEAQMDGSALAGAKPAPK